MATARREENSGGTWYGTGKGRRRKRTVLGSGKGAGNKIIEVQNTSSTHALETLI